MKTKKKVKGFTFIEFALTLAILSVVLAVISSILKMNIQMVRKEDRRIEYRNNAKNAMHTLVREGEKARNQALAVKGGKIVVNGDEWTLSNYGFSALPDTQRFIANIANWFTGGGKGQFLGYSSNSGLTESMLAGTLRNLGHSYYVSMDEPFTTDYLLRYQGVFVGGNPVSNVVLTEYVRKGGNVYVMAGTGWGGAAAEAGYWNAFLNVFGMSFAPFYNGYGGSFSFSPNHFIFNGSGSIYYNNGNDILINNPDDPRTKGLLSVAGRHFVAVYDPSQILTLNASQQIVYCQAQRLIDVRPRRNNDMQADYWYYFEADKFGIGLHYGEIRDKFDNVYGEYIRELRVSDLGDTLSFEIVAGKELEDNVTLQSLLNKYR